MCVCVCVRASQSSRACVRACVRACARVMVNNNKPGVINDGVVFALHWLKQRREPVVHGRPGMRPEGTSTLLDKALKRSGCEVNVLQSSFRE